MPGKHKERTISFRPDKWERVIIEERAAMSGLTKKKYISTSCLSSEIVFEGNARNIQRIIDSIDEMKTTLELIAKDFSEGKCMLSDDGLIEMGLHYNAICCSIVDIINSAVYNSDKSPVSSMMTRNQDRIRQLLDTLDDKIPDGDKQLSRGYLGDKNPETPETGDIIGIKCR